VFEARTLIEPRIARMAAKAMADEALARLQRHIDAEHDALKNGDIGHALSLSGAFHIAIAEIADQKVLTQILHSLVSRSSLIIALYWKRPDTACESHSHHALLMALSHHDETGAEEIMKSHIIDLHSGLDLTQKDEKTTSLSEIFSPR
jgi:DNA-binding GntR family transcriptional regulator